MFWIRDMMIREVSTYFYCHVSETKWALQYDWSKINIRSKFDPSVRRRVVRWTFLQHGISLTPCWGSIMAMRWTTFYHHSVDCNHGYHRCFFIISLFIEQMDFRLSWLALSTHCTTTCRVQTRLERKHRNSTKNPARNELTVSSRSTWSCWWAWSRRSPRRRPGEHFVFNHQDLLYRILKPALMQRAGVQFDHPTGIYNHISLDICLGITKMYFLSNYHCFRRFGSLLPISSCGTGTNWVGVDSRAGLKIRDRLLAHPNPSS